MHSIYYINELIKKNDMNGDLCCYSFIETSMKKKCKIKKLNKTHNFGIKYTIHI